MGPPSLSSPRFIPSFLFIFYLVLILIHLKILILSGYVNILFLFRELVERIGSDFLPLPSWKLHFNWGHVHTVWEQRDSWGGATRVND